MSHAHAGQHQCIFSNIIPCQCGSTRGCISPKSSAEYTRLGYAVPTADATHAGALLFLWKKPYNPMTIAARTQIATDASHAGGGGGSAAAGRVGRGIRRQEGDVRGILLSARAKTQHAPPLLLDDDSIRKYFKKEADSVSDSPMLPVALPSDESDDFLNIMLLKTAVCSKVVHQHVPNKRDAERLGVVQCSQKKGKIEEHIHNHTCREYWFPEKGKVIRRQPEFPTWSKKVWGHVNSRGAH